MRPIFLIGFMATGKTTVGRLVAARLGRSFVDLDEVIAGAAGGDTAEIFRKEGVEGFRVREAEALAAACRLEDVVVATGGGAASQEANLEAMLRSGRVVALSASPAEILRRTAGATGRPLLDAASNRDETVRDLLAAREPFYARAHHRVDAAGRTPEDVAARVVAALEGES